MLDFSAKFGIITMLLTKRRQQTMRNGVIGSTADSDSVSRGSSPFSVAGNLLKADSLFYRSVAQLGRALRSGRRGRRFESCHSDFFIWEKRRHILKNLSPSGEGFLFP